MRHVTALSCSVTDHHICKREDMRSVKKFKRRCDVFGCMKNKESNPKLSFFSIPMGNERLKRLRWLQLIGREELASVTSHRNRVCEIHFNVRDVQENRQRKLLKKSALPCLFLPAPFKVDKEIQTYLSISSTATQTDVIPPAETSLYNFTHTAELLNADTTRKRKLKVDLPDCKKWTKLKEVTIEQEDIFYKMCDRFLSKDLAEIIKAQTRLKLTNTNNR
ncbi:unnamed protein product [Diatraea saccharalis]|uniref:THAP-type domain-containing protein n=1 Tax=Diatraea saccharalis TaxID=40085 RepID=A0A9N9R6K9_9NEOP|nr:unnamed protein product [Diatraea saccharalis]